MAVVQRAVLGERDTGNAQRWTEGEESNRASRIESGGAPGRLGHSYEIHWDGPKDRGPSTGFGADHIDTLLLVRFAGIVFDRGPPFMLLPSFWRETRELLFL
jgi:hypothetical protein